MVIKMGTWIPGRACALCGVTALGGGIAPNKAEKRGSEGFALQAV